MSVSSPSYFHMSASEFEAGTAITGNGRDKVDVRIEDALENLRPAHLLGRREAVYFRVAPDFSKCGILNAGYIYRVEVEGDAQLHDLTWIGEMQKPLLKAKYPDKIWFKRYPDWTEELIERCCRSYWAQEASADPIWEGLARSFTIAERLSSGLVQAARTAGGWQADDKSG